jgi:HlyD family secretion protein
MRKTFLFLLTTLFIVSCKDKREKTSPEITSITESIYASGIIKSKNQYQAFAKVTGIIENIYVSEGDTIKKGNPLLSIADETQKLNTQNSELAAKYADFGANKGKLEDARLSIELSKNKLKNDSVLFYRQRTLWGEQVGTKVELEQKELAFKNAKTNYLSALIKYNDLQKQLNFSSLQSKKNLMIASKLESDYTLKSEIDGVVYSLLKNKGELVGLQTPLAIIGDGKKFILEMQVDEYDITKTKKGLAVVVTMDSYKGKVFNAIITKIYPILLERSKTFLVEAEFMQQPSILYPNTTFEASIIIQKKDKALLIPRNYMLNDSTVIKSNGDKVVVKTGLKDYNKIEILSGLKSGEELVKPKE